MTYTTNPYTTGAGTGPLDVRDLGIRLGQQIADEGISSAEQQIAALARVARRRHLVPAAADVLDDPTQAEIARCRAFALVVSALAAAGTGDVASLAAA